MAVRVQVPLAVLKGKTQKHTSLLECVFGFLLLQVAQGTYAESPARGTERKGRISLSYSNGILLFFRQCVVCFGVGEGKYIRKMQTKCGPCPRAEWQGCTFEGTDLAMLAHLEVTATPRSLNTTKIA